MLSNGRIAAVTGAGTGIGRSAVINLLSGGYSVALAGRRLEPLLDTIQESNPYSELLQFEKNSNSFRSMDTIASTPIVKIIDHQERVNGITVKEWK